MNSVQSLLRVRGPGHSLPIDDDLDRLTSVRNATYQQDAGVVALAHAGASSYGDLPDPYSKFTEGQLDTLASWSVERMEGHDR